MKKAVTIKSIAEQLGLSRNTVAKALNGQYVPEATREKVFNKAKELNYKSLNASHISVGKKRYKILLVSGKPLINFNYFIPLVKGIENACFENGYDFFQYTYNSNETPFSRFADHVTDVKADGIVAIECFDKNFVGKLVNLKIPVCFCDFTASDFKTDSKFDIIGTDNEKSISDIVKMLHYEHKIKRFTFVGDRKHCRSFHERYLGMRMGIIGFSGSHSIENDILCNDESFPYGNPDAIKTEILKLSYKPECFICCNDFVARNVINALKTIGMKVPENILVVGFDNVPDAVAPSPGITSFSIDKEFIGKEMIRTLVHRIENPSIPSRIITLKTKLILRESTNRQW